MSEPAANEPGHAILLFDGVCNLCDGLVQFVLTRDPKGYFRFAALQSEAAAGLIAKYDLPTDIETMILIENGRAYLRSSAGLRVFRHLRGAWPALFYLCYWVPAPIRDVFYRLLARNRYRLFGKKESCMIPTPEIRARFLV
jgi:predicted DCC family thiol-disulfide oxidoreductase YuxK